MTNHSLFFQLYFYDVEISSKAFSKTKGYLIGYLEPLNTEKI